MGRKPATKKKHASPEVPIDPALLSQQNEPPNNNDSAQAPADGDKTAIWTKEQDAFLLKCLLERRGKHSGNGWPKSVWVDVADAINKEFPDARGLRKTHEMCKNKYNKLKKQYKDVAKLRGLSGFGWDPDQCLVTAPDDVWEPYLAAHPTAKPWRKTPFPLFDDMANLTGDSIATGSGAVRLGAAQGSQESNEDDSGTDSSSSSSSSESDAAEKTPAKRKAADELDARKGKKPKPRKRKSGVDGLFAMSHSVEKVADSLTSALAPALPTIQPSPVRVSRAIAVVEKDGDLSDDDVISAAELFEKNTRKADVFLAFTNKERRNKWLLKQIHDD